MPMGVEQDIMLRALTQPPFFVVQLQLRPAKGSQGHGVTVGVALGDNISMRVSAWLSAVTADA